MKIDPIESWEEGGARFIRERITQLRLNHNLSEYALSYELGNNRNYIGTISRGHALPQWQQFFKICDVFHITPAEFFDSQGDTHKLIREINENLNGLPEEQIKVFWELSKLMNGYKDNVEEK